MSDHAKASGPQYPICKFVSKSDADASNDVLRKPPDSIDEWKASINRCMTLVEKRLDEIERQVMAGGKAG